MDVHGREWRSPAVEMNIFYGCSRSCVAYTGPLTWNVEWIFSVVSGVDMEMSSGCSRYYMAYAGC